MNKKTTFFALVMTLLFEVICFSQRKLPYDNQDRAINLNVASPVLRWDFEKDNKENLMGLKSQLIGGATIEKGVLILEADGAYLKTEPLPFALGEKTLVGKVYLNNLEQRAGGLVTVESLNGITFDSIVFAEDRPKTWCNGSEHGIRFRGAEGEPETSSPAESIWLAISYSSDGKISIYRNGVLYRPTILTETPLQHFKKKKSEILIGKRHESGGSPYLKCRVEFVEIYDKALNDEEIATVYKNSLNR